MIEEEIIELGKLIINLSKKRYHGQPERLNPEGFHRNGAQQNVDLEYISIVLGPEFVKSSDSLNSMET